jgi:excisionase family DNA binding protein
MPAQFLTPADVASLLRVSTRQVRRLSSRGLLPRPVKFGHKTVRYRLADLQQYLAAAPASAS